MASGDPLRTDAAPATYTRAPPGTATPAVAGWPDPEASARSPEGTTLSETFHALSSSTASVWLTTTIVSPSSPLRSTPLPTQQRTPAQPGIQGSPQADADLHVQDDLQRCTWPSRSWRWPVPMSPHVRAVRTLRTGASTSCPPLRAGQHGCTPPPPGRGWRSLSYPTCMLCFCAQVLSLLQAKARLPHGRCHSLPVSFTKPFPC